MVEAQTNLQSQTVIMPAVVIIIEKEENGF